MPVLLSPSIDPDQKLEAWQGVGALITYKGLQIGRIQLGDRNDPDRWPDSPSTFKAILTDWRMLERVLAQIEPSLNDDVYIWSSGDSHTDITIEGLALQVDCRGPDGSKLRHGFSHVHEFYRKNRLSARTTPMLLQIGDISIQARLLALQMVGVANANVVRFSMTFVGSPPPRVRRLVGGVTTGPNQTSSSELQPGESFIQ